MRARAVTAAIVGLMAFLGGEKATGERLECHFIRSPCGVGSECCAGCSEIIPVSSLCPLTNQLKHESGLVKGILSRKTIIEAAYYYHLKSPTGVIWEKIHLRERPGFQAGIRKQQMANIISGLQWATGDQIPRKLGLHFLRSSSHIAQPCRARPVDVQCRSLSAIFYGDLVSQHHAAAIKICGVDRLNERNRYPGPLGSNEYLMAAFVGGLGYRKLPSGVPGLNRRYTAAQLDLPLSSFVQAVGGSPEQDSRNRKDDGESSGDGLTVFVNELTYAVLADPDRSYEIGDTFFRILGGVLLAMLAYAALKRL